MRKRVTQDIFDSFVILRKAGVKYAKIAEILHLSTGSVYQMNKCGSYEAYDLWRQDQVKKIEERKRRKAELLAQQRVENTTTVAKTAPGQTDECAMKACFKVNLSDDKYDVLPAVTAILNEVFDGVELTYEG